MTAPSAAAPPSRKHVGYDLSQLGFNDGDPYRLSDAEAEAILGEPGAEIFQFEGADWMREKQTGSYVAVADVVSRFPERPAHELIAVYQVDVHGDRAPELLLVPRDRVVNSRHRYAPTLITLRGERYRATWAATNLRGQRFRVVDIRDLDSDGRPELLLKGEGGDSGAYQFFELIGHGRAGSQTLPVGHVDSIHYVDLDGDKKIEVVLRERVGRRGPARLWTYVDRLYRWTGRKFAPADEEFPRYHDEQTLPALLGEIIDHHDAKAPILAEKVDAILAVRERVLSWGRKPRGFRTKMLRALRDLKRRRMGAAKGKLKALDRSYPYDLRVLLGLAQVYADEGAWDEAMDAASRALTVDPKNREAWWWTAVALSALSERSSAVASLVCAVRLTGSIDEGIAFLAARRGEPGMEAGLQAAIDQALSELRR